MSAENIELDLGCKNCGKLRSEHHNLVMPGSPATRGSYVIREACNRDYDDRGSFVADDTPLELAFSRGPT